MSTPPRSRRGAAPARAPDVPGRAAPCRPGPPEAPGRVGAARPAPGAGRARARRGGAGGCRLRRRPGVVQVQRLHPHRVPRGRLAPAACARCASSAPRPRPPAPVRRFVRARGPVRSREICPLRFVASDDARPRVLPPVHPPRPPPRAARHAPFPSPAGLMIHNETCNIWTHLLGAPVRRAPSHHGVGVGRTAGVGRRCRRRGSPAPKKARRDSGRGEPTPRAEPPPRTPRITSRTWREARGEGAPPRLDAPVARAPPRTRRWPSASHRGDAGEGGVPPPRSPGACRGCRRPKTTRPPRGRRGTSSNASPNRTVSNGERRGGGEGRASAEESERRRGKTKLPTEGKGKGISLPSASGSETSVASDSDSDSDSSDSALDPRRRFPRVQGILRLGALSPRLWSPCATRPLLSRRSLARVGDHAACPGRRSRRGRDPRRWRRSRAREIARRGATRARE